MLGVRFLWEVLISPTIAWLRAINFSLGSKALSLALALDLPPSSFLISYWTSVGLAFLRAPVVTEAAIFLELAKSIPRDLIYSSTFFKSELGVETAVPLLTSAMFLNLSDKSLSMVFMKKFKSHRLFKPPVWI